MSPARARVAQTIVLVVAVIAFLGGLVLHILALGWVFTGSAGMEWLLLGAIVSSLGLGLAIFIWLLWRGQGNQPIAEADPSDTSPKVEE